jgi:hypothetical protein
MLVFIIEGTGKIMGNPTAKLYHVEVIGKGNNICN